MTIIDIRKTVDTLYSMCPTDKSSDFAAGMSTGLRLAVTVLRLMACDSESSENWRINEIAKVSTDPGFAREVFFNGFKAGEEVRKA